MVVNLYVIVNNLGALDQWLTALRRTTRVLRHYTYLDHCFELIENMSDATRLRTQG